MTEDVVDSTMALSMTELSVNSSPVRYATRQLAESGAMPPRIQHVSIPVPPGSDQSMRDFYGGLLQLDEMVVPHEVADLDVAWYRLGETELHLFAEQVQADRSARHFCIAVDDVDEVRVRLEAAGVPVVSAAPLHGRSRYFCRDPFGNLMEFTNMEGEEPTPSA